MITSALLRTETERWREEVAISRPAWSYLRALGRLGMTGAWMRLRPAYRPFGQDSPRKTMPTHLLTDSYWAPDSCNEVVSYS